MRDLIPIFLIECLCQAQSADEAKSTTEGKPATTTVLGAANPKVHPDLSVTFRIKAPEAKTVQVDAGELWDMERDSEGVWTTTIPLQVAGLHYYYLNIDGVRVSDPGSESFVSSAKC